MYLTVAGIAGLSIRKRYELQYVQAIRVHSLECTDGEIQQRCDVRCYGGDEKEKAAYASV